MSVQHVIDPQHHKRLLELALKIEKGAKLVEHHSSGGVVNLAHTVAILAAQLKWEVKRI